MVALMKLTRARIILIAVLITLLAAYTQFGFFGVPRLLRSQATDFVAEKYHRKVEIGEIHFNPFTLVLRVHGVAFPDSEGQTLLGFRDLLVNLNLSSLFRLAPSFAAAPEPTPQRRVVASGVSAGRNLRSFATAFLIVVVISLFASAIALLVAQAFYGYRGLG